MKHPNTMIFNKQSYALTGNAKMKFMQTYDV